MTLIGFKFIFILCLLLNCATALAVPVQVKVGILFSRTGSMADIGAAGEHGFQLAIEKLKERWKNERYTVSFVFEDSRSAPDSAATAINKLIKRDRVHVILGDLTSTATLAAAPIAQSAKVPLLSPSSTSDKVTQVGDYVFRACYVDSLQGLAMANFAYDTLKARTATILVDMDMDHSRDVSKVFISEFLRRGGRVLDTVTFSGNHDTSYVPQMTELRTLNADVIYAPVYYSRMGTILRQAGIFKIRSQFLGTDAWDSPQLFRLAAGATEGSLITDPFSYQNPGLHVQEMRNLFKTRFGSEPSSYGALAYDSVFVLEKALSSIRWPLKNVGLSQEIRNRLVKTQGIDGITGRITLDQDRNVANPDIVILKLTKDGYAYHSTYRANYRGTK